MNGPVRPMSERAGQHDQSGLERRDLEDVLHVERDDGDRAEERDRQQHHLARSTSEKFAERKTRRSSSASSTFCSRSWRQMNRPSATTPTESETTSAIVDARAGRLLGGTGRVRGRAADLAQAVDDPAEAEGRQDDRQDVDRRVGRARRGCGSSARRRRARASAIGSTTREDRSASRRCRAGSPRASGRSPGRARSRR